MVAAVALLVAAGGAVAWKLMQNNQTAGSFDAPESTVATIGAKMKDLVGAQGAFVYSNPEAGTEGSPQVYVPKDDYAVAVDTTKDMYVAIDLATTPPADSAPTQAAAAKKADELSAQLSDYIKTTKAFTVTTVKQLYEAGGSVDHIIFSKTGEVCDAFIGISHDYRFSVGCVKQAAAEAGLVEYAPFISEYLKHGTKATTYDLVYVDGKNSYKIANLLADLGRYVFLQKSGGDWQYFQKISYQSPENCSLYEVNTDATLAFAGDTCYRNNVESTVGK